MPESLAAGLSTILICIALIAIVALIIIHLVREKRHGKSFCGCGCSNCAMRGSCHSRVKEHRSETIMYETDLKIDGMMCGMCEAHVNDAVRRAFPVKKVSSSHTKGKTEIISEAPLDEEKLKAAVSATGYTVTAVKTEPYEKKSFTLFKRV